MSPADVSALGEFEQVVLLSILRLGDDAYAVSVRDEIARCTGREVSRGSIYITLDRLEDKGLLTSQEGRATAARGHRPKRIFKVTPAGLRGVKASVGAVLRMHRGLESVLGRT